MADDALWPPPMDEQTARWYVDNYGEHVSQALTVEVADIRPGDVVLDIGCGSGYAVRLAAQLATSGIAIGVDPSPAMLGIAREETVVHPARERITFLKGSAERIPLDLASVTIALAINSVHHWYDLQQGLAEISRVLGLGGRLIITEERLSGGRFGHGQGETSKPESVAQALRDAGLVDVRIGTHSRGADAILFVTGAHTAPR